MKVNKISRRAFLLGLGTVSTAALLSACGGSASSSSAASGSAAAAGSDVFRTLDEIKADGTVNIGVFSDKNPFGYVDENGEYQGYDVYFARRLAEDLGVEANFVSTEAANRIEYLQTGKVDIILANFTVTPERAEAQFGFLMNAFKYGAPPHAGLAFGLDRFVSIMAGLDSIRDCIAFPKNNSGRDVMLDAPSEIDDKQLDELQIKVELKA